MKQSVTLELSNNKHSKVYEADLAPDGDGWVVLFRYGAKGSVLQHGTKTKAPTSLENAQKIFDKLVAEKTGKKCECCGGSYVHVGGLSVDSGKHLGTITIGPGMASLDAQLRPIAEKAWAEHPNNPLNKFPVIVDESQIITDSPPCGVQFFPELLTPITEAEVESYLRNPLYEMEEKLDGNRVSIYASGALVTAFNRKGEVIPVPSQSLGQLLGRQIQLDGEFLEGRYVAFDILMLDGVSLINLPRHQRRHKLASALVGTSIERIQTYTSEGEKRSQRKALREAHKEGVVFKHAESAYMPGRGGVNVKDKFWESATVRVCDKPRDDGKASFGIEVLQERPCGHASGYNCNERCGPRWINVGTVTLSKTAEIPESGSFREVKYLYVGAGGKLVQAEDKGPRTDVGEADCAFSKLKHKPKGA